MSKKLHDFHGGIHPPENKSQSTQTPIEPFLLPDKLILPLQQHIGQQAKPLVDIGDTVLKGQMIAAAGGYVSAPLHAPTSGTVVGLESHPLPHPSGLSQQCIIIEPDDKDSWIDHEGAADYRSLATDKLLELISNAGITGLGGAGFPTAVKLNPSEELRINTLILNAAECEPYITADDMLMRERADEVVQGLEIIAHILQPERCLIGIEDNKPEAIKALEQAIADLGEQTASEVISIPTKYPSGGEKQLIQILTGQEVPNGGIPADIGMVCHNVGTAVAVYRAVIKGEPLISRITTVTGEAVSRQGNIEVLLGTPIEALLSHFGLQSQHLHRLVMGGPMMGFTLDSTDLPIIKTSNCILAATREELPDPAPEQACIRCGMCAEVCPATLLPQQLYWYARAKEFDKALDYNLLDCIECGACSYVCPSNIPLVQYYRFAKGEIRIEEHERTAADHARQRFEARQARLEQEQAEKEAKRKARAEAAAARKTGEGDSAAPADAKAAVVQAALERAKARKAQKAAASEEGDTKPAAGESALERAKAKKAAAKASGDAATSAVERAKARKAQKAASSDDTESKPAPAESALERAKAKRAQSAPADTDKAPTQKSDPEPRADKQAQGLSALERAKARRARRDDSETPAKPDKAVPSALERTKAKRAAATTAEKPATDPTHQAEKPALSALDRAKAKRAQRTDKGDEAAEQAGLSAVERAKAKRARNTAQEPQPRDESSVNETKD